jgi:hypothetical protein
MEKKSEPLSSASSAVFKVVHFIVATHFIYATYYNFRYIRIPGREEFGGKFMYLTFWNAVKTAKILLNRKMQSNCKAFVEFNSQIT